MPSETDRVFRAARRVAIALIGVVSVIAGLAAAFRLMPDHIPSTPTAVLVGLAALVLLPGLAVAAWAIDCRALAEAVHRHRRPASAVLPAAETTAPATTEAHGPLLATITTPRIHAAHTPDDEPDHRKRRPAASRV